MGDLAGGNFFQREMKKKKKKTLEEIGLIDTALYDMFLSFLSMI